MNDRSGSGVPEALQNQLAAHWQAFSGIDDLAAEAENHQTQIVAVWQVSDFAVQVSQRHANWLLENLSKGAFSQPHQRETLKQRIQGRLSSVKDENELMQQLRVLRQQEMLRILWREVAENADLDETLIATSDLADLLVDEALGWLYQDACSSAGVPRNTEGLAQSMIVLGMGKLGGEELNFSSDIDLIFAYPERGQTDADTPLDNEVFFTRLGQRLIKVLDQNTADGFVYRVDMRLRPFGESGALVMHFDGMEHYYESHGREWERYALVKARPIAGDVSAGEDLLGQLRGFVYRRYLDYGVIESLREMKALISRQAAMRGKENDLKLGPGGIREIEFIAQMFQLIHGGRNRPLQLRSLLPTLGYIGTQGWLSADSVDALEAAYRFLRKAENHLQMQYDRQVHALPENEIDRWRLTQSMGYANWEDFLSDLDTYRERVKQLFQDTFQTDETSQTDDQQQNLIGEKIWRAALLEDSADTVTEILTTSGIDDVNFAQRALQDFLAERSVRMLSEQGRQRLDKLMPLLLSEIIQGQHSSRTLSKLLDFIASITRRTSYLAFLAERPQTLNLLIKLCETSDWITDYLTRHPMLLDELLNPATLFAPPDKFGLQHEIDEALGLVDPNDHEAWINQLRHFKQTQTLRVAAADIMDALPLMRVSDHLTWIAEVILGRILDYVWQELVAKSGVPQAEINGQMITAEFVIIGYGKLGGLEMGYGSDLDLVFLHNAKGEQQTNGEKPQSNGQFFARLGQRIISILNTFTTSGKLYEVDMRLRPSGSAGLLVSNIDAFRRYQKESAWLWEHQALVRARPVCGSEKLSARFVEIRREILCQKRDAANVAAEVKKMREKMWQTHNAGEKFNLKKSPGGITDIEFMVQYLVLAHAHEKPQLTVWTDNIRILESLAEAAVITEETAERLADI
ncbi:MAG TPA: bifunctional [glutamate--ammonia ligase]-adenylyl-L-tyrosine phosphorylase/[glutamate--ammonia-ligase] adenylyltransferase, partial [Thiotrichales bacterium]|nr:bifunctional [glutamate--ammonia ligase]-adenylyl-L-tyrosine phosphorylase/[glutamate--ammonia-ligase] adenylyltransferase [Thiotrichales bacterium]